jgi:hypothetical protein
LQGQGLTGVQLAGQDLLAQDTLKLAIHRLKTSLVNRHGQTIKAEPQVMGTWPYGPIKSRQ